MSEQACAEPPMVGELPRLEAEERFCFGCAPGVPCFNACCRELDLLLNPYDVLRLRHALQLSSRAFLGRYAEAVVSPAAGFPAVRLKMDDELERRCPFVTDDGCAVYADRPAACRSYPLGRGISLDVEGGRVENWCLVREAHCRGHFEPQRWTPGEWLRDQGVTEYAAFDDRYLALMARVSRGRRLLRAVDAQLVALAVYQVDDFGVFLSQRGVLERGGLPCKQRQAVLSSEVRRLDFALEWLERRLAAVG